MQKSSTNAPANALSVQDILFVLFKHKWMILVLSALGLTAAGVVYRYQEPQFKSHAKLLVRYVLQRENTDSYQNQATPGADRVNSVINTEIEILTSVDLALEAAEKIGLDKLLPESGGKASLSDGAGVIMGGLEVGMGQSGNILHVVYAHPDPELAKLVLKELMECYFHKHLEIHRSAAAYDLVAKQTEGVRERLRVVEEELGKLRTESGILSLENATGALETLRARTNEELTKARAEYAETEAGIQARDEARAAAEGEDKKSSGTSRKPGEIAAIPAEIISEYRTVVDLLDAMRKSNLELGLKFKPGNRRLVLNQQQITTYEARLRALLDKYPDLAAKAEVEKADGKGVVADRSRLAALAKKIEFFEENLKEIGTEFAKQYTIGSKIQEMERRRQMEEAEYLSLETKLKNAKLDSTLDPSRMPNITVVQHPTEPVKSYDEKTTKIILGLAGGGMAMGLGLAFLIELLFNRKVNRPIEIQTRLQLPLLLSIPFIRRKERGGFLLGHDPAVPRIGSGDVAETSGELSANSFNDMPAHRSGHFILPYSETIRDRIIFNFEVNNLTHKPKLVAVTGLSEGAGASTIAAGLAKSFAEIPGMKVLLVDLSSYHPEDNPIFGEIPRHSLNGALHLARNTQFRENPQNLYYASATARRDESGMTTFSPVHLYELMPHLQASEYDYIVFDMPPVDQTSRTLTMAGLMDKVLLVLDAENTSRDGLMWGYSELVKGRADVSCIFNKTRSHAPGWLIGEN